MILIGARPAIGPRVNLQPTFPFRAAVAKEAPRPPALEAPAAPHAHLLHVRKFEGTVYPAAATPARRPHIPVRMIIERNENKGLRHASNPKCAQMMKIARAVEKKRRKFAANFLIELFN